MAASAVVLTVQVVATLVRPPAVLSLTVVGFSASSTQRSAVGSPNSGPTISEPMKLFSVASDAKRSSLMSCLIAPACPRSLALVPLWVKRGIAFSLHYMHNRSMYDAVDLAWGAGLYEGEGTIYAQLIPGERLGNLRSDRTTRNPRVTIRMSDPEPLLRMQRIFGGKFYGPYRDKGASAHHKDKFAWYIHSWLRVLPFCEAIRPYLSPRRTVQMDNVLAFRPEVPRGAPACNLPVRPDWSGYKKHRVRGEKSCERCLESYRLALRTRTLKKNPNAGVRAAKLHS